MTVDDVAKIVVDLVYGACAVHLKEPKEFNREIVNAHTISAISGVLVGVDSETVAEIKSEVDLLWLEEFRDCKLYYYCCGDLIPAHREKEFISIMEKETEIFCKYLGIATEVEI